MYVLEAKTVELPSLTNSKVPVNGSGAQPEILKLARPNSYRSILTALTTVADGKTTLHVPPEAPGHEEEALMYG